MVSDFLKEAPKWLAPIAVMYDYQLDKCGINAKGAMWRSKDRQQMRFELLTKLIVPEDLNGGISINDLGCGYGALFEYLRDDPVMQDSQFYGYDISEKMIEACESRIQDSRAQFYQSLVALVPADYSFACGPFNFIMEVDQKLWLKYVQESLKDLWSKSLKGLAFNMLNVNYHRQQEGLYYADSGDFETFCKNELSENVTLMTDYDDEEWTIFIRR
ncbi:MAG: class I SAM-dependent methyltransferase [Rhodospirillaceae bacterium]|jgi:SAM-dependent methyltransferase